jgi:hypothetical protein
LCGGSELWLGSAMPSWRMAGWLWRMAEASWKSLRWWRKARVWRKGEGVVERGSLADWCFFPLRLRSSGALIAEINERDWRERGLDSENDPTISFSFCELLIARTARAVKDVHVFCEWKSSFPFEIASVWKCMIGVVSCRIVVWMCLTVCELLRSQGGQWEALSVGHGRLLTGVSSICRTSMSGSASVGVWVVCFHWTLSFGIRGF